MSVHAIARVFLPRSTIGRIAIAFVGVQLLTLGTALFSMQLVTQEALDEGSRQFVAELNQDLTDTVDRGGRDALIAAIDRRTQAAGRRDAVIALIDGNRRVAGNLETWPVHSPKNDDFKKLTLRKSGSTTTERMLVIETPLTDGERLIAGETLTEQARLRGRSWQAFLAALMLGTVLAAIGSYVLTRLIGRRVDHVTDVAEHVGSGDLAKRVAISGSGDAFDRLGGAINVMLGRIESLVAELRLVTDSLAHDLRSPVARLKARLEGAARETSDPAAQLALGMVIDEADRLQNMLATALQISRAEAGIGRNQFQTFSAAEMISDLAEVYGPVAEDQGLEIRTDVEGPVRVSAHRELLGQAIANLIDNALIYATGATAIDLGLAVNGHDVLITVADDGPGIAEAQRADALRRFGRLDTARQATGAGLGLSLVSTLAHLHGGRFELDDNRPGLIARLTLPIISARD